MLSSTTAFLPLPCNICRASKYPEFANLDSAGSIKNGRELVITFLLHLQSQSIFHMIFNYWFCSLCLFGQRRINPGIYRKMKGQEKEKTVKLFQAVTFCEKTLCPCLFTWMLFFCILRKHVKKHAICQELAIAGCQLTAQQLALHRDILALHTLPHCIAQHSLP